MRYVGERFTSKAENRGADGSYIRRDEQYERRCNYQRGTFLGPAGFQEQFLISLLSRKEVQKIRRAVFILSFRSETVRREICSQRVLLQYVTCSRFSESAEEVLVCLILQNRSDDEMEHGRDGIAWRRRGK